MRKQCTECQRHKPASEFRRHARSSDGRSSLCEQCFLRRLAVVRERRRLERARLVKKLGRRCTRCGETKPAESFTPRSNTVDGLMSWCRQCAAEKQAKWNRHNREASRKRASTHYWKDPEKFRARSRAYAATHPERVKASRTRWRRITGWQLVALQTTRRAAKIARFGKSDLDRAYIDRIFKKQRGRCYWLGIPMVPSDAHRDPRRPSVDRIDNTRGYVKGNVVLACMFANMGRSQLDADAFRAFIDELKKHFRS